MRKRWWNVSLGAGNIYTFNSVFYYENFLPKTSLIKLSNFEWGHKIDRWPLGGCVFLFCSLLKIPTSRSLIVKVGFFSRLFVFFFHIFIWFHLITLLCFGTLVSYINKNNKYAIVFVVFNMSLITFSVIVISNLF